MPEFTTQDAQKDFKNVLDTYYIYDTAKIYKGAKQAPVEFEDCSVLADQTDGITFISGRTASDIGKSYCNITTRDNLQKPFWLESAGMHFHWPNPTMSKGRGLGDISLPKYFMEIIPEHCHVFFNTDTDTRVWCKPYMMPPGYGPYGGYQLAVTDAPQFMQGIQTSGVPHTLNRFTWLSDIVIPAQTKIEMVLYFSKHARDILRALGEVPDHDINGKRIPGMAKIEVSLRGILGFQQRGQYRNPGSPIS